MELAPLLAHLGAFLPDATIGEPSSDQRPAGAPQTASTTVSVPPPAAAEHFSCPEADMDEEDREIVSGFIVESLESLETVEVSLIDLEQDDSEKEGINAIFRAFHTIKGVSSFLGFMRINRLAHRSENLLDKIRSGEFIVDGDVIDVILDSVDLLKRLIQGVQTGMEGGGPLDIGLNIAPVVARIEAIQAAGDMADSPIGEILVDQGAISRQHLDDALTQQKAAPGKKLGRILVEAGATSPKQVAAAAGAKKVSGQRMDLQVKVDTLKLDSLVDLTGELVIAQSMLRQHPYIVNSGDQHLLHTLGQLNQITSSLQTMTMSLRMVPIKSTFQKMLRLVRDLAKSSGKKVQLRMTGEDTEIDRNMVDELYEPMVHMIRNSVDHGLETPEDREAVNKSPMGTISLKAYHKGGNIVVEIDDDGRGLNRDRILQKARANGLIDDDSRLSDSEIYNLIFQPGFSTARAVTEISGRGVGMDVVKKAIERLRGRVDIQTTAGQGSTFYISLPLTLAIIEGMLVRVGQERYVIPALSIIESFRPTAEQYYTVENKGEMILSRGKLIPLVRLETLFDTRSDFRHPWEGLVVTVEYDGQRMGLLLDELLGKEEVVIKSMGVALKHVRGIAGGAILGDGRVGLILDMAGIWELAMES
ncbi:chemotaxis protein CheA [Desulfosarcina cetonica]|uniref:chemotaxis protein CheA n=1 Tax=Desulfosarcina cetonica TaxID=90730 RepID=UPI0006CFE211|nr:chemotaxis protein CheA [Desulfosarcina cetonica]